MIVNNIKQTLSEIKMSQQEFADLGFKGNRHFVSDLVNNKKKRLSLETAFRASKVLKRPIDSIFKVI